MAGDVVQFRGGKASSAVSPVEAAAQNLLADAFAAGDETRDAVYDQVADTAGLCLPEAPAAENSLGERLIFAALAAAFLFLLVLVALGLHDTAVFIRSHWRGTAQATFVIVAALIMFTTGVAVDRIDRRRNR